MRILRSLLLLPLLGVVILVIVITATLAPRRWFYRDRRPTRLGRIANGAMGWWSALGGPPSYQVALETTGWRSGQRRSIPIVIGEHEGREYIVSMLGERSPWVRNIRASGGRATLRHGAARDVRLVDVPAEERAPIIRAYLKRAIGGRPHITVPHDAPVSAFEPVAGDYPVFRIEPAPHGETSASGSAARA
jgi:hypothetical protein